MKQFFPKNFHHFSPTTSFWPPKQHFLSILDQFWQISAFYSTVTSKLPPYHKGDCLYNTQEVILKQFFPKFFTILALWRHFDPPKTALFEHFWRFFAYFRLSLNYDMEITPIKPWWRLFIIHRRLYQNTILALWRTFWAFWANFSRFQPFTQL